MDVTDHPPPSARPSSAQLPNALRVPRAAAATDPNASLDLGDTILHHLSRPTSSVGGTGGSLPTLVSAEQPASPDPAVQTDAQIMALVLQEEARAAATSPPGSTGPVGAAFMAPPARAVTVGAPIPYAGAPDPRRPLEAVAVPAAATAMAFATTNMSTVKPPSSRSSKSSVLTSPPLSCTSTLRSESNDAITRGYLKKDAAAGDGNGPDHGPGPGPVQLSPSPIRIGSFFFDLLLRTTDVVLNIVYLATYSRSCHALVTPTEGGSVAAEVFLALVSVASTTGIILLLWDLRSVVRVWSRGFSWMQAMAHVYTHRTSHMRSVGWNWTKFRALVAVFVKDLPTLLVVSSNLGPRDANLPTLLRIVISALLIARHTTQLTLMTAAACCCARKTAREFAHSWPFLTLKLVLGATAFATCLFVPLVLLVVPDLTKHVYVTQPIVNRDVTFSVLCVADAATDAPGVSPTTACNPQLCSGQPVTTLPSLAAWSVLHNRSYEFTDVDVCSTSTVRAQFGPTTLPGSITFPLPDARTATYVGDVPCTPPVDMDRRRLPDSAWAASLVPSSNVTQSPYRAQVLRRDPHDAVAMRKGYARKYPDMWANRYVARDLVRGRDRCARTWVMPVRDAGTGDKYLVSVEIKQTEVVRGPLSCSFNGWGVPPARRGAR
ncbi:hypothetical protein GGF31_003331 [Allomyces arbusculus]|nr:hypothetical protein GGF31_003331 [Allomyces arbusculus]